MIDGLSNKRWRQRLRGWPVAVLGGLLVWGSLPASAQTPPPDPLSWDQSVQGLFRKYCMNCHGERQAEGAIDFSRDADIGQQRENRRLWLRAVDPIEYGEMPPPSAKQQPTVDERALMVEYIQTHIAPLDCGEAPSPGPTPLRRLTRYETGQTLLRLFGDDFGSQEILSADASAAGFDNIAAAQSLTDVQLDQLHKLATRVADSVIDPQWSGEHADAPAMTALLHHGVPWSQLDATDAEAAAADVLNRFTALVWRRPTDAETLADFVALYRGSRSQGRSVELSVADMVYAVLISPRFLYRLESLDAEQTAAYLVDDSDLANRLSYFLWSAPPDQSLLAAAQAGGLNEPAALEQQLRRMLADVQFQSGLLNRFVLQWLSVADLEGHSVDQDVFPDWDPKLVMSMQNEVVHSCFHWFNGDGRIDDLLRSDRVWIDQPLAEYYGLQAARQSAAGGTAADQFVAVDGGQSGRGGLLTTAAVLLATADPNRTNVPHRGNYVASVLLGDPPPPPPPDVPPLETAASDRPMTLRERFERHRADEACASCHAKIDAIGFGLENFDAVGRWRTDDGGLPIDASGELSDGTEFDGPEELKRGLLTRRDHILEHLTRQMMIYAYGRTLSLVDECNVQAVVKQVQADDYRLQTLVLAIVQSDGFRYRSNPEY